MIKKRSYTLDNGMRVMFEPVVGTETVSVLVMVKVGSRYESKPLNGASHFIEHMMFKGTKRRPTAQHISRALDAVGADFNAFTGKSYTGYYVKLDKSHLELGIDLLDDMLFASKIDVDEMNRERGAIVEEIHMYEDNPMMHVGDLLEQTMFDGSTLGWEIAGTEQIVRDMDHTEMVSYYKEYYQPSNMVLVISGNVNRQVEKWIQARFGKRKSSANKPGGFVEHTQHADQKMPRAAVQNKPTEQVQLAIGFPSFGMQDERNYALALMGVILGGNMSSRLFTEVRERKGLAYFVRARNSSHDDIGNFMIRAGLDKKRMDVAMKTILKELRKMKREKVTAKELRAAKDYVRGQMAIRLEDSYERAQWYAREKMFSKRVRSPKTYLKNLDAVTTTDILNVAKDVLNMKQMHIAAVGPYKDGATLLKKIGV
ncbi:MAG: pitrilysin family protein [bacterium]|jgi:predicted Zn-dependent peptidase|nr:pitrilysin family protein [bacterium]